MKAIAQASANHIPLADESVSMVVTSPPYYGLRKYEGQRPTIWGGDPTCQHPEWKPEAGGLLHENRNFRKGTQEQVARAGPLTHVREDTRAPSERCTACGAWRGILGMEPTPQQYVSNLVEAFREVRRVLRPRGTFWLNLSDSFTSIGHKKSSSGYGTTGLSGGKAQEHFPLGRENNGPGLKHTDLIGIPWAVAFALRDDGWWLRRDIIWNKLNGMPEPGFTRPASCHEYIFMLTKSAHYYYDWFAVREEPAGYKRKGGTASYTAGGSASHGIGSKTLHQMALQGRQRRSVWSMPTATHAGAHYATFPLMLPELCILAGTSEKGECPVCRKPWRRLVERVKSPHRDMEAQRAEAAERTGRTDGHVPGPEGMVDEVRHVGWKCVCEHDVSPVPAVVLDPFFGSGTTGEAARLHGRSFVGLDLSMGYLDQLAKPRALQAMPSNAFDNLPLFGDAHE